MCWAGPTTLLGAVRRLVRADLVGVQHPPTGLAQRHCLLGSGEGPDGSTLPFPELTLPMSTPWAKSHAGRVFWSATFSCSTKKNGTFFVNV
jgi:hypothetical protein